jgi:hypothetical protein
LPQIGGNILFSANCVWADRIGGISRLVAGHWQRPVLAPVLPRLADAAAPPRIPDRTRCPTRTT